VPATQASWLGNFVSRRWFKLVWVVPVVAVVAFGVILCAQWVRTIPSVRDFLITYPGQSALPSGAPVGFPAWLEWQHFLSSFFLILIFRTGWQIRTTQRPPAYWTRSNTRPFRTKNPPVRIGLHLWLHLGLDVLWVANGALFYVLLFVTGQWARLVPTRWDIFPNALSTALQYSSLRWPSDDGWTNYNALQTLSYFVIVFVAAPLAIISGVRMVPGLARYFAPIEKIYPIKVARAIHFPVMIVFVVFVVVHVTLVLAEGALRNLNHMYGGRDDTTWWGAGIFIASTLVIVAAWIALRPTVIAAIAGVSGNVRR
jgi:thiosulfate reductase cytochrome b subunit